MYRTDLSFSTKVQMIILALANKDGWTDATNVRRFAHEMGIVPTNPNQWGAAFRAAKCNGLVEAVAMSRSALPTRNGGVHMVWQLTETGQFAVELLDAQSGIVR
jgi:hypothetical protein